jgi:NAD(P)-dependent dehydrogenase (short-subunit alcohol dehydrogenase family)
VNRRVLITGAAGGIGAAAADEMRRRGAQVVGLDLRADADWIIECDVTDQASVDRAVGETIERLGGLDVLVNNAGLGTPQSAGAAPDAAAMRVFEVNLIAPWRVTSAAIEALRASPGRGRVVNVSSGLAFLTVPFATAYTMTKRGLVGYSDALRIEHGDAIDVTTVYPGYIRTAIHSPSEEDGFALNGIVPEEPLASAAATVARAALGRRPVRDLATTRRGEIEFRLLRLAPRRPLDRGTLVALRLLARRGKFARTTMAREFVARLSA